MGQLCHFTTCVYRKDVKKIKKIIKYFSKSLINYNKKIYCSQKNNEVGKSGGKWGMNVTGEIDVTLDEKNRLTLPSEFRREIPDPAVKISKGRKKFLQLLTVEKWEEEFGSKINKNTNLFSEEDLNIRQKYIGSTRDVKIDSAGRILIPERLLRYAGITKDCVVVGMGEMLAIWDTETYDKSSDENDENNAAKYHEASEKFSRKLKKQEQKKEAE